MPINSYRDLEVWQVGMRFAEEVYQLTRGFPREETYGLSQQLRRAAVGIPSNVSEGHQRGTRSYAHFVTIALGSQAEAETQLELARRLRLASPSQIQPVIERAAEVGRLLRGLLRGLHRNMAAPS